MKRLRLAALRVNRKWLLLASGVVMLAAAMLSLNRGSALMMGTMLVLLSLVPWIWQFERRPRQARELVLIAVMAAIASISRIPFATLLPGFTPVTFVIIVTGVVFGAEAGWMVGVVTGFVSNMFLGQGPWTPWQMFAWGLAGFTAGLFARSPIGRHRWALALFGVCWGYLYGWITNATIVLDIALREQSWQAIAAVYVLGLPFDTAHAAANLFFAATLAPSWIRMLERYRRKYGAVEQVEYIHVRSGDAEREESTYGKKTVVDR
jgi:energy-coupling factor transport system substrate-specific component